MHIFLFFFFFFNDTATTEIYTLSLHDALPISVPSAYLTSRQRVGDELGPRERRLRGPNPFEASRERRLHRERPSRIPTTDRKSTRLNSSHGYISYAVFCLKKKKQHNDKTLTTC